MAAAVTGPSPSANALKFREAMEQLVWDKTDGQRCLGGPACFGESKKGTLACMGPKCTYEPTAVDVDNAWVYWFPTTKRAGSSTTTTQRFCPPCFFNWAERTHGAAGMCHGPICGPLLACIMHSEVPRLCNLYIQFE